MKTSNQPRRRRGLYSILPTDSLEEPDLWDVEYTNFTGIPPPFIVSKVDNKYLTVDNRDTNSKTLVYFRQMYYSDLGYGRISGGDTNILVFSFPDPNERFGDRVLTFQEYIPRDPNEPNVPDPNAQTFPVYLVKDMIADGNGVGTISLPDLEKKVYAGTWHYFVIRTDTPTRELAMADFDRNGMVDVNDANDTTAFYQLMAQDEARREEETP